MDNSSSVGTSRQIQHVAVLLNSEDGFFASSSGDLVVEGGCLESSLSLLLV